METPRHRPDLDAARAAYTACLIKYPGKLLYLTRRVPACDQNDADQVHRIDTLTINMLELSRHGISARSAEGYRPAAQCVATL